MRGLFDDKREIVWQDYANVALILYVIDFFCFGGVRYLFNALVNLP